MLNSSPHVSYSTNQSSDIVKIGIRSTSIYSVTELTPHFISRIIDCRSVDCVFTREQRRIKLYGP